MEEKNELTAEKMERIRAAINKDIVEWTILLLLTKRGGCVSTFDIMEAIKSDTRLKHLFSRARMSHAKDGLVTDLKVTFERGYGSNLIMNPKLLAGYQKIFSGIDQVLESIGDKKIGEGFQEIQKRKGGRK